MEIRNNDYVPPKSTEITLARDSVVNSRTLSLFDLNSIVSAMENLGITFTRGGVSQLQEFLVTLENSGDIRKTL